MDKISSILSPQELKPWTRIMKVTYYLLTYIKEITLVFLKQENNTITYTANLITEGQYI